jgi:hypothetical protein
MLTLFDFVRFAVFGTFGIGIGFMLMTNVMAFMVLRPPKRLGFLWWHVTAISLSFLCIGVVAADTVAERLGESEPGWRSALTLFGMTLYMVAQIIIFGVERQRLINSRAMSVAVAASPPGTYKEP